MKTLFLVTVLALSSQAFAGQPIFNQGESQKATPVVVEKQNPVVIEQQQPVQVVIEKQKPIVIEQQQPVQVVIEKQKPIVIEQQQPVYTDQDQMPSQGQYNDQDTGKIMGCEVAALDMLAIGTYNFELAMDHVRNLERARAETLLNISRHNLIRVLHNRDCVTAATHKDAFRLYVKVTHQLRVLNAHDRLTY